MTLREKILLAAMGAAVMGGGIQFGLTTLLPSPAPSGSVQAGQEALALIGGLDYGVGDTLPNTGDVIRFIGSDGVRLYSPSRNAEWTLPYSGDDI